MASSKQMFVVLAVVATTTILPSLTGATEFVVGDDMGWRLNFNYTAWAEGKEFRVGDKLVFKYKAGAHNVYKVGGPEFTTCIVPLHSAPLATGNDVITLATEGRKWYICGVGNHCMSGMKLVITVQPAAWKAPAPSPSSATVPAPGPAPTPYWYRKWLMNY